MSVPEMVIIFLLGIELASTIIAAILGKWKSAFYFLCAAACMLLAYYLYTM